VSRPIRFTFILFLAGLCTTLAAVGGWRYARASSPLSGPIILISIDTLRADHLPPYGYTQVKTPAIAALAADGVVFERAYSHSPQTLPAHTALLSGRLPSENGVRDDEGAVVKAGERMLPQMLRDRGYATAGVVSTPLMRKETGIGQGFEFFDPPSLTDARTSFGVAGPPSLTGTRSSFGVAGPPSLTDARTSFGVAGPPSLTDARTSFGAAGAGGGSRDGAESEKIAERWLASHGSTRAFLFLHLDEPRAPYAPPDRFSEYAPYDGEIAYADEIVGRLVKYLKSHQLYDRSTIILLSDHGEGLGDHGEEEHGLFVHEEAIHVPLIIKQESNTSPGRRVSDVVQHIDLVPTILDLVKAPIPWGLRGRSLKPLLEGTGRPDPVSVHSESLYGRTHFGWSELTALTSDRAPAPVSAEPLADPAKKSEIVNTYRQAVSLAADGRWREAIPLLQTILRDDVEMAQVWRLLNTVASRIDRQDDALNACWYWIGLKPEDPAAYLAAAATLVRLKRLDEAREQATVAADIAPERDRRSRASAHELLARIALAKHDPELAREEAALARKADPGFPFPQYIEARLLYDQGRYEEALPLFEQAAAELKKPGASPIAELHFYMADVLTRLDRVGEAEAEFLEELGTFPQNLRARSALAMLYHTGGRSEEATTAVSDMVRAIPTPDGYAAAARLLTTFGDRRQAEAVRAEGRRVFAESSKLTRRSTNGEHDDTKARR
jgi:arylsulfatase A-like enzyme